MEEGQPVGDNVLAAMRHRMDRAADIIDKPDAPADLVARASELSARQEELLISIQGQVSFKAAPEYGRTLAVVHDVRLVPAQRALGAVRSAGAGGRRRAGDRPGGTERKRLLDGGRRAGAGGPQHYRRGRGRQPRGESGQRRRRARGATRASTP